MRRSFLLLLVAAIIVFGAFASALSPQAETRAEKDVVVALIPHQDDEVFMAGHLYRYAQSGKMVYAVLVTDGARSKAREMVNGVNDHGKRVYSLAHRTYHNPKREGYEPLSREAFTTARNKEFVSSMEALGISQNHVIIMGLPDGNASKQEVHAALDAFVSVFKDATFVTLAAGTTTAQHPDHRVVREALQENKNIKKKLFFSETKNFGNAHKLSNDELEAKKRALGAYAYWKPEEGRFAIGEQSVKPLFNTWLSDKNEYTVTYE